MDFQLFTGQVKNQPALASRGTGSRVRSWFLRGSAGLLILAVVLPLAGMSYQFIATRIDERRYLPPGQLTNVDGYMLHIHCEGTGPPTIIVVSARCRNLSG